MGGSCRMASLYRHAGVGAALFGALLAAVTAIQINPRYKLNYEVTDVCGKWRQGLDNKIGQCRSIQTGGGGLHFENDITDGTRMGPKIVGTNDVLEFGNTAEFGTEGKYNTFKSTTTYWDDAPCFTRKKTCTNYNSATSSCAAGDMKDCPSWQVTGKKKNCPSGVPGPGDKPYCFGSSCPVAQCMDEEFYPGCGAYPAGSSIAYKDSSGASKTYTGGTKQMTIEMRGTTYNMFKAGNKVAEETCEVICPCTEVSGLCYWKLGEVLASGLNKQYSCSEEEFKAYQHCMDKRSGQNLPAFRDPYSTAFNTDYTNRADETSPDYYGRQAFPVRFEIKKIEITPHTTEQVDYLNLKCNCKSWVKGGMHDIIKCSEASCDFLKANGMFHQTSDVIANCPQSVAVGAGFKPRCKFAQVYRHDGTFLYIGTRHNNYAATMRAPPRAEDVFTLVNVNPGCIKSERADIVQKVSIGYEAMEDSPAPVTATASAMFTGALAIMALAFNR